METALTVILAALTSAAVFYVQKQIPFFTEGRGRIMLARLILLAVGVGFGLTVAASLDAFQQRLPAFLIGFGLVHVPAAIILFIKGKRGEGKS